MTSSLTSALAHPTSVAKSGTRPDSVRPALNKMTGIKAIGSALLVGTALFGMGVPPANAMVSSLSVAHPVLHLEDPVIRAAAINNGSRAVHVFSDNVLTKDTQITPLSNPFSEYRELVLGEDQPNSPEYRKHLTDYTQLLSQALLVELPHNVVPAKPSFRLVALCQEANAVNKLINPPQQSPASFKACTTSQIVKAYPQYAHQTTIANLKLFGAFGALILGIPGLVAGYCAFDSWKERRSWEKAELKSSKKYVV